jgi:hypothetical protein
MKTIQSITTISLLLSIFFFASCKKDEVSTQDTTPAVTEKGTPTGSATTAIIGTNGGTLTTPDGVLTLTIPAGALASNVTISAQPITNTAPGGTGVAYRLEPEEQKFGKPVSITFKYKDEDFDGSTPDLSWIITQEKDGTWSGYPNTKLDLANKTLQVESTHFSDWGYGKLAEMSLNETNVVVEPGGKPVLFILKGYTSQREVKEKLINSTRPDDAPLPRLTLPRPGQAFEFRELNLTSANVSWELDGKKTPVSNDKGKLEVKNNESIISATYTPPTSEPIPNVVALGLRLGRFLLTANITISKLGLELTIDGKTYKYSNDEISSSVVNNMYVLSNNTKDSNSEFFMLAVNSPREGQIPFNFSNGQNVTFLSDKNDNTSLYPAQNLSCKIVKNDCECQSSQFSDWQITFIKYFPEDVRPFPEAYILEGIFSGSLTKDYKRLLPPNAPCNPVTVGFSGKFKLKSYYVL